jgi:hypothetical protein
MTCFSDRQLRAGALCRLYEEFARYYVEERCEWAPANPRRVFNLAFERFYPGVQNRMSPEEFLGVVYQTLGFRGTDRDGLFQTFNPALYRGHRPLDDHFVSFFARKLKGKLGRAVGRTTDRERPGDPHTFRTDPGLGLVNHRDVSDRDREHLADLPAVLSFLDPRERAVVHLLYWDDLSTRKAATLLNIDHKTVARVRDGAVAKLRRLYGVEEEVPDREIRSPERPSRCD